MRYIDFTVQSLLILLGLGTLIFTWEDSAWPRDVLIVQLLLGPWQVLSSVIGVTLRSAAYKQKTRHLIASAIYIAVWIMAGRIGGMNNYVWNNAVIMSFLIIPPWILVFYCYRITWRITFPGYKRNGNFLSHINF
jgi:hypothetical protein